MTTATSLYGQSLYDLARRSIQGPAASVSAEFLDDPA